MSTVLFRASVSSSVKSKGGGWTCRASSKVSCLSFVLVPRPCNPDATCLLRWVMWWGPPRAKSMAYGELNTPSMSADSQEVHGLLASLGTFSLSSPAPLLPLPANHLVNNPTQSTPDLTEELRESRVRGATLPSRHLPLPSPNQQTHMRSSPQRASARHKEAEVTQPGSRSGSLNIFMKSMYSLEPARVGR